MAFNVNNFRSKGLVGGGARPSLFEVEMTLPSNVGNQTGKDSILYLVRAAQIPAATLDPVEVPYFGRKIKIAGDRTFADWTVTVMNDENFQLRSIFENWSNKMNSLVGNLAAVKPGTSDPAIGYKTSATVRQYGREGKVLREYVFSGIFPTTIDAIALDWDNTNAIETFDVTFAYDWWEPTDVSTGETDTINVGYTS